MQIGPTDSMPTEPVVTVRRPSSDDALAELIEAALWDARGDTATASVVAADAIRAAGYRLVFDGPIEAAARAALPESDDPTERLQHELIFRGARALDDPQNARYYSSTVEAMRKVLADIVGPDGGGGSNADIVEAIRSAGRDRDASEVDHSEESGPGDDQL